MTGRASYAGTLVLASALGVLAISPALAATPNESYAALATGPLASPAAGLASFPGHTPVMLTDADIIGLLTSGSVTDAANAVAASATVTQPAATLSALATLTAESVTSSCGFNTNTDNVNGAAMISGGQIDLPKTTIALPANPAPNTVIAGLGGVGTVTLNAQSSAGDGRLTVTAIQIAGLANTGGGTQTLSLGVATCNTAHLEPVPVLPGKSAMAAISAALALAGTALRLRRRRKT
jgi:hypothetical protein